MLDVRRLRIFSVVAEQGSLTAAAKVLFMTPSAVSQQVALLERQLGLALVVSGPRGVEPTGAGRLLAERSVTLLGDVASLEREMRELGARVRLAADPLYVLFPADHPLAGERHVRLADLAGERWVVRAHQPPYDEALATMCRLSGFSPDIGFVTEDYAAAQGMVAAGIGVSAVPRMSLASRRPDVVAVPMAGPARCRRIAVLRSLRAGHPQAAERMLTVLRDDMRAA